MNIRPTKVRVRPLSIALALVLALLAAPAIAAPQLPEFTYQGRLSENGAAANGNFDLAFALFDASTGGNQVGATINETAFPVTDGLFSVSLAFPGAFDGTQLWLQVTVDGTPLLPRTAVTATPVSQFALSGSIGGVAGGDLTGSYPDPSIATGAVTSTKLGTASVTTSKLATASVTSTKLGAGAVTSSAIADGAVTTAKLGNNSLTRAKISGADVTGSLGSVSLPGGSCADVNAGAGGAAVGDVVIVGLQAGTTLPSKFIMLPGRVDTAGAVVLRFCNIGTSTQSFASLPVHILTIHP